MSQQERVRYHEFMRPRFTNPTYASTSVGSSIGMLYWHETNNQRNFKEPYQSNYRQQAPIQPKLSHEIEPVTQKRKDSGLESQKNQNYPPEVQPTRNVREPQHNSINERRNTPSEYKYKNEKRQSGASYQKHQQALPDYNINPQYNYNSNTSRMSNFGSNSLQKLPRIMNQRDIYDKQQTKYNIISIQPKQFNESIKKYPKYHLENMDVNYFRKLQLQNQYATVRNERKTGGLTNSSNLQNNYYQPSANYNSNPSSVPQAPYKNNYNQYTQQRRQIPQNNSPHAHGYEHRQNQGTHEKHVGQQYNPQHGYKPDNGVIHYRPKFLNNVDELGDVI